MKDNSKKDYSKEAYPMVARSVSSAAEARKMLSPQKLKDLEEFEKVAARIKFPK